MPTGHPIAIIDPVQLEGSNDFGKNFFTILAVGAFPAALAEAGARAAWARAVKMEKGRPCSRRWVQGGAARIQVADGARWRAQVQKNQIILIEGSHTLTSDE